MTSTLSGGAAATDENTREMKWLHVAGVQDTTQTCITSRGRHCGGGPSAILIADGQRDGVIGVWLKAWQCIGLP